MTRYLDRDIVDSWIYGGVIQKNAQTESEAETETVGLSPQ